MLKVKISDYIVGIVDPYNITDIPSKYLLNKNLVVGKKIKTRVLFVDPIDKKLKLSIKPTFLNKD
jgi:ribosomal protein S1